MSNCRHRWSKQVDDEGLITGEVVCTECGMNWAQEAQAAVSELFGRTAAGRTPEGRAPLHPIRSVMVSDALGRRISIGMQCTKPTPNGDAACDECAAIVKKLSNIPFGSFDA